MHRIIFPQLMTNNDQQWHNSKSRRWGLDWNSLNMLSSSILNTPWKIDMEPTNHPFRKENDLNQTSRNMFHVNLQGCNSFPMNRPALQLKTSIQPQLPQWAALPRRGISEHGICTTLRGNRCLALGTALPFERQYVGSWKLGGSSYSID